MRGVVIIIIVAVLLFAKSASAAPSRGFAVDRFEPSERGSWFFVNDTLDFKRQYALGVVGSYAYRSLVGYTGPDADTDRETVDLVRHQLAFHAGGSVVLAERLRLALDVPLIAYQDGDAATFAPTGDQLPAPTKSSAVGDLRLATDFRIFGDHGDAFVLAGGLRFWIPTGVSAQYAGDGSPRLGPQVIASGMFLDKRWVWAARMAFVQRWRDDQFANNDLGAEISESIAIGARLLSNHQLLIGPELFGSTGVSTNKAFFGKATTPLEALVGAHYDFGEFRVGGSLGTGLTAGMGAPTFRMAASIEWVSPIIKAAKPPKKDDDDDTTDDSAWSKPVTHPPVESKKPLAKVTPTEIKIEESVKFETDSATLLPSSDAVLTAVKRVLDEHPEIKKLNVEGHTDNVGDDQYNFDLSTRRATSVVTWLTNHGIASDRLSSQGFGSREPIDTNETEAGRANNRRVVFKIVERSNERTNVK